jgi:hypothetical protein
MANRHRGEIDAMLDGRPRKLVLTLGALAELEAAFGADNLADLAARFSSGRLSARDLMRIVQAGLNGAGESVSEADVARMTIDGGLAGWIAVVAALLEAAFSSGEAAAPPRPRQPQAV